MKVDSSDSTERESLVNVTEFRYLLIIFRSVCNPTFQLFVIDSASSCFNTVYLDLTMGSGTEPI
jgi:hypothetical protein